MIIGYRSEMGEARPAGDMEASLSHSGNHWYVQTSLGLKGRGIRHIQTLTSEILTLVGQRKVGWNEYKITESAMDRLQTQYAVTVEMML